MKKFISFLLLLSIIILSPFVIVAQTNNRQTASTSDRYDLVDGHKIHYQIGGKGTITVVFESGLGSDLSAWDPIFNEVAKFAKVLRYDREGYGSSELNTLPVSFKQIATRLHKLLQEANANPPYVLVGHSFGGAIIRAFTFLYPNEIAGLVFVDPFNEYEMDGLSKEQIGQIVASEDSMTNKDPSTLRAETNIADQEFINGFPEIKSFGALPDIPMILFAAGKDRPPVWEKSVRTLFVNKMDTHSESRFIDIPNSPHFIQYYEPSLVIENIRRVVFPDAENVLKRKTILAKGTVDSCIVQYKKIKLAYPKEYILERFLNTLGYGELRGGHTQEAIRLFQLNVEVYPNSMNVYDSLGEAYMNAGNKKEAIINYEKSLALNPA